MSVLALPTIAGFGIVTDIQVTDLNGDELPDLVLFRTGDGSSYYAGLRIQALVNQGDRTFADESAHYFGALDTDHKWIDRGYQVDLDGDGRLDFVGHTDLQAPTTLPPLMRQADGSFIPFDDPAFAGVAGMVPMDVDDDGDIDVLSRTVRSWGNATQQQMEWSLLANQLVETGTASFHEVTNVASGLPKGWDFSAFAYAPAVIHLNDDEYPDLVYGGPKWKDNGFKDELVPLTVLMNSGANTFVESASEVFGGTVPLYTHVREMVVADLDEDGIEDIFVANSGYDPPPYPGEYNAILYNERAGTLSEYRGDASTLDYKGFSHSADIGDLDADGDLDVVVSDMLGDDTSAEDYVRVLLNEGDGTFVRSDFRTPQTLLWQNWTSTLVADLDGDGYAEIVLGSAENPKQSVVLWNGGARTFAP